MAHEPAIPYSPRSDGDHTDSSQVSAARLWLYLGLAVAALVGPWVQPLTAQPGSRLAMTAAIADEGRLEIDSYEPITAPIDRVERDGHLYSDKAPGQPVLAVPFYAAATAVGFDPAVEPRIETSLTLWWVTFWSSVVPTAVTVILMALVAARFWPSGAVPAALCVLLGTMMLVVSNELYGHALATALAFAAWAVLSQPLPSRLGLIGAGALTGAAVATEYPFAAFAIIYAVYLVIDTRSVSRSAWFVAGGLPFGLALAGYQLSAFGNPLQNSYAEKYAAKGDTFAIGLPDPSTVAEVLGGSRGFIWTPVILVGMAAAGSLARRSGSPARRHGVMALVVAAAFIALQGSWSNPWGGEVPFPRYTYPLLPFLAVPIACYWERWRIAILVATAIGAARMVLPLLTYHLLPHGADYVATYRHFLDEWGVSPSVYTIAIGPLGWIVQAAVAVGLLVLVFRERGRVQASLGPAGDPSRAATPAPDD